jgi:dienelactone hydrolase
MIAARLSPLLLLIFAGPMRVVPASPLAAPPLWAGLEPGPHAVGFGVALERDAARPLKAAPRPVQVGCWYPTRGASGTALTYGDYFVLSANELDGHALSDDDRRKAIVGYKNQLLKSGVRGDIVDRWFASPMLARRDAPVIGGALPLALVAQGNFHSLHHQAILAEYLASHGYVVCSTPSQTRISGPLESEDAVAPSALEQAGDLEVARRHAVQKFTIDAARLGLAGHSFGARSALIVAARANAGALVSLDGGIGARQAKQWVTKVPEIDPARIGTPILHLYEDGETFSTPDFELIERMAAARRMLVKIDGVRHVDFTSIGFAGAAVPGLGTNPTSDYATRVTIIAVFTRRFLDATLKNDAAAERLLERKLGERWLHARRLR